MIDLLKNLSIFNRRTSSSVIRELLALTNKPGIISFAGGLPDPALFPEEIVEELAVKVLRENSKSALQYGPTEGMPGLKEEIIKLMKKDDGLDLRPENILITTASQQGLDLIAKTFIDASDPIIVELPSYIGGLQVFRSYGASMIGVSSDNDGILIDDLEKKLKRLVHDEEHYKFLYLVPDFQNPSGVTLAEDRRKEVVRLSEKYNILIIEDSPYRAVRFEGKAPEMIYKLDNTGNVVSLCTFSKTFAPGFRVGYMIGHEDIIARLAKLKQSLDLCTSSINQLIIAEFLKSGHYQEHLKKIIASYKESRDVMIQALEKYMPQEDGVSWTHPSGGLFLWLRLPEYLNATEMFNSAIEKQVAYVIGSAFHCDNSGENTMRLNFSYPTHEEIDEGVKRLAKVIKDNIQRGK